MLKNSRDGHHHQGTGVVVALRPVASVTPFKRFHTLGASRRRIASQFLSKRPFSTINLFKDEVETNSNKCDRTGGGVGCKRNEGESPTTWAASFEKLLEDPVGLHAFAEFLKKEFSAENIYFWAACERYRRLPTHSERVLEAQRIFHQHVESGAVEAVNVDAHALQTAEQGLPEAGSGIFDIAQSQIFNLMKFDSYPRFLKSQLYKQCLGGEMPMISFDSRLSLHNHPQLPLSTPSKLKKSLSNAEDRRRKSLLPWHRKNAANQRSKSKDRNELGVATQKSWDGVLTVSGEEGRRLLSVSDVRDVHSSHSSLTSLDLAASQDVRTENSESRTSLCRVLLSNGSTTVVQIKEDETIQELIARLLEKRGLTYSSYEVFTNKHPKALNITDPSTTLAGCEVTIEQRVVFKLDLPNRKIISVKSKYTKNIVDVLKPILHKYKFNLEEVVVTRFGESVDISLSVTTIDNARLNIQLKDTVMCTDQTVPVLNVNNVKIDKLEEITNKVYEGILQEKSKNEALQPMCRSDKGSVKSEDWGSEHSSLLGKFLRKDSGLHGEKKKKVSCQRPKLPSESWSGGDNIRDKKPLIAKLKAGANKLHVGACSESDELVEGLTRAQRRLEDQRGTEINFELPDFLKDKEERLLHQSQYPSDTPEQDSHPKMALTKTLVIHPNYENQHVTPVPNKADSPVKLKASSPEKSVLSLSPKSEPPPLPPKPKIVPIKPANWGQAGFYKANQAAEKRADLFLEQPSSSFV
ncbi:regulator of G-protein signaling loco isoform X2 [Anthonomus grandis grandis]|uniref:regulator of G-protein signaling loco isoform X2 n=1 Tax=Anthonomus grandis grandis TaxID=2921223 RepID=UPI002165BBB8|nr:regulator of G-protein signaling loco isoform X2 [Anthonomus grandis grandis]